MIDGGTVKNLILVGVEISATGSWVGGIAGAAEPSSRIENSFVSGSVTGGSLIGGLVGANVGTVASSYSAASVTGGTRAGGLVGINSGAIENSYAVGAVTGQSRVGGLVGFNDIFAPVENSYSLGAVSGVSELGGLVGAASDSSVSASYFDKDLAGQSDTGKGIPLSSAQMKTVLTYKDGASPPVTDWAIVQATGYSAPNFLSGPTGPTPGNGQLWGISEAVNCGYPFLWWQVTDSRVCPNNSSSSSDQTVVEPRSLAATGGLDGSTALLGAVLFVAGLVLRSLRGRAPR